MKAVVHLTKRLNTDAERISVAAYVAGIIFAMNDLPYAKEEVPYSPNAGDTFFMTLDHGNDWKISFSRDNSYEFEIWHRYQVNDPERKDQLHGVNEAVKALVRLVAYHYKATTLISA